MASGFAHYGIPWIKYFFNTGYEVLARASPFSRHGIQGSVQGRKTNPA